jgi:hypothetical protein
VFSNAWQNGILSVIPTQISNGANKFKAASMARSFNTSSRAELYRGSDAFVMPKSFALRFSEYTLPATTIDSQLSTFGYAGPAPTSVYAGTPVLKWSSTKNSGDAISKPEAAAITAPQATWNTTTNTFDMPSNTVRSLSARTFAFDLFVEPYNSLTGFVIGYAPSGSAQAGAKAGVWQ